MLYKSSVETALLNFNPVHTEIWMKCIATLNAFENVDDVLLYLIGPINGRNPFQAVNNEIASSIELEISHVRLGKNRL